MAKKGYYYIKGDQALVDTFKEFVKRTESIDTVSEFLEKNVIMFMLAKDRELFLEILEEKMSEQNEEYKLIQTMIQLFEVMNFYNRNEDKVLTKGGEFISVEELLENGFKIKNKQLIMNK